MAVNTFYELGPMRQTGNILGVKQSEPMHSVMQLWDSLQASKNRAIHRAFRSAIWLFSTLHPESQLCVWPASR